MIPFLSNFEHIVSLESFRLLAYDRQAIQVSYLMTWGPGVQVLLYSLGITICVLGVGHIWGSIWRIGCMRPAAHICSFSWATAACQLVAMAQNCNFLLSSGTNKFWWSTYWDFPVLIQSNPEKFALISPVFPLFSWNATSQMWDWYCKLSVLLWRACGGINSCVSENLLSLTSTLLHLSTPSHNRKQEAIALYSSESGWYVGHVRPKNSPTSQLPNSTTTPPLSPNTTPSTHWRPPTPLLGRPPQAENVRRRHLAHSRPNGALAGLATSLCPATSITSPTREVAAPLAFSMRPTVSHTPA